VPSDGHSQPCGGCHATEPGLAPTPRRCLKGEVYVYTPAGDGYGKDIGLGSWNFSADGNTHSIQQSVKRSTGQITVWYDGKQVPSSKSAPASPGSRSRASSSRRSFGGHETSWGPKKEVHAYFSNFKVSTTKL
jgi:hypothetical protein